VFRKITLPMFALLTFFAVLLLSPVVAFAAPSDYAPRPDEPLDVWLKRIAITTVIAGIAYAWSWLRGKKAAQKVVKYVDEHRLVQMIADQAIGYVEELDHKARKLKERLTESVKESEAVKRGLELLEKYGFDTKKAKADAEAEMRKIILARLGATRTAPKG